MRLWNLAHAKYPVAFIVLFAAGFVRGESRDITVTLVGDSTVTDSVGWGKAFAGRINEHVTVRNFAVVGYT
ncbi:MAG: hypothetical protein WCH04_14290 [Gammaproteobacteria bacterium]